MQNLEAKFHLRDLSSARTRAQALGYVQRATLRQRDTFFQTAAGKLKLREVADEIGGSLIFYARESRGGLQISNYEIVPVADPAAISMILSAALGVRAEVKKVRTLLTRDNVRLHLDAVEDLGDFGEIEVVAAAGRSSEGDRAPINELLAALDVSPASLIERSYFEMLMRN